MNSLQKIVEAKLILDVNMMADVKVISKKYSLILEEPRKYLEAEKILHQNKIDKTLYNLN